MTKRTCFDSSKMLLRLLIPGVSSGLWILTPVAPHCSSRCSSNTNWTSSTFRVAPSITPLRLTAATENRPRPNYRPRLRGGACREEFDWLGSQLVSSDADVPRELSGLVVPRRGSLVATGELFEPFRLVDGDGAVVVVPVAGFFAELAACGRPATTQRSYGMDLLRWFRFLWEIGVGWDQATRVEARDFCRWLQVAVKPTPPHWRHPDDDPRDRVGRVRRRG